MGESMISKREAMNLRIMLLKQGEDRLPAIFGVLGDPGRFRIFSLLMKKPEPLCVTEVASVLVTSVPAASQQLKLMELAGLIRRERMGQKICYQVNSKDETIKDLIKFINSVN